jgi:ribosomal protein S27AE
MTGRELVEAWDEITHDRMGHSRDCVPTCAACRLVAVIDAALDAPLAELGQERGERLYAIVRREGVLGIECGRCGAVSFNPNDVKQAFCGACHRFLEDEDA